MAAAKTMKQVATLIVNGEPILSYKPSDRLNSVSLIPTELIKSLGERFLGDGFSYSYYMPFSCCKTESPEDGVFVTRAKGLEIQASKIVEIRRNDRGEIVYSHVRQEPTDPKLEFEWEGINDFRSMP